MSFASETIRRVGIIPIVRVDSSDVALRVAETLAASGLGIVEVTMTVPNAIDVIGAVSRRIASDVLLGAGTVTTPDMVDAAVDAGCQFVVTPCFLPEVVERARHKKIAVLAGALTPTEIFLAHRAGADLVKVFPANAAGGPGYLRALKGPFPHVDLVPTGGVSLTTIGDYIKAGAAAVGVGGELISQHAIASGDFSAIREMCGRFLDAVNAARSEVRPQQGR